MTSHPESKAQAGPVPVCRGPVGHEGNPSVPAEVNVAALPAAGPSPAFVSALRAADAGARVRMTRSLQRRGGNAALQRLVVEGRAPQPVVQRIPPGAVPPGPAVEPPKTIPGPPSPEAAASALDKIKAIVGEKQGEGNGWVGPVDEAQLGGLWGSFGTGLPDAVDANLNLWDRSIGRGMEMSDLSIAPQLRRQFASEVTSISTNYLDRNLADATAKEKELGFDSEAPFTPDQLQKQKDLESMAIEAQRLKKAKQDIETRAYVGWEKTRSPGEKRWGTEPMWFPVTFTAGAPPAYPVGHRPSPGDKPMVPYDEVMGQWKPVSGMLLGLLDQHPALFAAETQGRLDAVAGETKDDNPVEAARQSLADTKAAIVKTQQAGLDWHELKPIHRQLLAGEAKNGSTNWSRRLYKDVLKEEVGDYETVQAGLDLALGMLAAVAFLFAEIASGGTATAVLLAAGGALTVGQTAGKWNSWRELDNAAEAATSSATALVDQGQVTAALVDAVLQTAFAALDAWQAGKVGIKAAGKYAASRAGAKAAEAGLENFGKLNYMDQLLAVDKGIQELGIEQTMRKTGISDPNKLKGFLPENSASWLRVDEYAALAARVGDVDVGKALADLGPILKEKGVAGANDIVAMAIERMGPQGTLQGAGGWSKLASALGDGTSAGKRLMSWRDSIYADLKKYVSEDLRAVVEETGSLGSFTNDLDMSFMGKDAAANRSAALQFLSSRSGMGADAGTLDKMLFIGLFTDPRRIHVFDQFPELASDLSKQTTSFEEQLIWSAEYHRVVKDNPARAQRVLQEMEEVTGGTVKLIPNFQELSERGVDVLSAEQDRIWAEIEPLLKPGQPIPPGTKEKLRDLAMVQAQINIKEGGGYFTGGGVRRFVTEDVKKPLPGYEPGKAPLKPGTEAYQAAHDQVRKLRDAIELVKEVDLSAPSALVDLPGAVKKVAKYGERFSTAAKESGVALPAGNAFDDMASEFDRIIKMARNPKTPELQTALRADAEAVMERLMGACATFDGIHASVLRSMRTQAGLIGQEVVAADILKATATRYKWVRFKSILFTQAGSLPRLLETLTEEPVEPPSQPVRPAGPGEAPYPEQPGGR